MDVAKAAVKEWIDRNHVFRTPMSSVERAQLIATMKQVKPAPRCLCRCLALPLRPLSRSRRRPLCSLATPCAQPAQAQRTPASDKFDKKNEKQLGKTLDYLLSRIGGKKIRNHERKAPAQFHGVKRKVGDASGSSTEEMQKYKEKYEAVEENVIKKKKQRQEFRQIEENKIAIRQQKQEYYEKNKSTLNQQKREHYKKNKSTILNKQKQKRTAARRERQAQQLLRIQTDPKLKHLTPSWTTDEEIERIFTVRYAELGHRTIEEALAARTHATYFGVSKNGMECGEPKRFLCDAGGLNQCWRRYTKRGLRRKHKMASRANQVERRATLQRLEVAGIASKKKSGRNRPVVLHANGSRINRAQAKEAGILSIELSVARLRSSVCAIEDAAQTRINKFPLGLRLHRAVAAGNPFDDYDAAEAGYLVTLFLTIFPLSNIRFFGRRHPKNGCIESYDIGDMSVIVNH